MKPVIEFIPEDLRDYPLYTKMGELLDWMLTEVIAAKKNFVGAAYITTPVFTGAGLDDFTVSGTYTGGTDIDFRVEIDGVGVGTYDTFRWSADGGSTWMDSSRPMAGAPQALSSGVYVDFIDITGHTIGDYWDFTARTPNVDADVLFTAVNTGRDSNLIRVEYVDPDLPTQDLEITVENNNITISLATDVIGSITTTANDIVAAINSNPDSDTAALLEALVTAQVVGDGTGLVTPVAWTNLQGGWENVHDDNIDHVEAIYNVTDDQYDQAYILSLFKADSYAEVFSEINAKKLSQFISRLYMLKGTGKGLDLLLRLTGMPSQVYEWFEVRALAAAGDPMWTVTETVGDPLLTGTGLDDMDTSGDYTGNKLKDYRVEIETAGTPDTFRWSSTDGLTWHTSGVSIVPGVMDLEDGIEITFAATTGHTVGDYWDFAVVNSYENIQQCAIVLELSPPEDTVITVEFEDKLRAMILNFLWVCLKLVEIRWTIYFNEDVDPTDEFELYELHHTSWDWYNYYYFLSRDMSMGCPIKLVGYAFLEQSTQIGPNTTVPFVVSYVPFDEPLYDNIPPESFWTITETPGEPGTVIVGPSIRKECLEMVSPFPGDYIGDTWTIGGGPVITAWTFNATALELMEKMDRDPVEIDIEIDFDEAIPAEHILGRTSGMPVPIVAPYFKLDGTVPLSAPDYAKVSDYCTVDLTDDSMPLLGDGWFIGPDEYISPSGHIHQEFIVL